MKNRTVTIIMISLLAIAGAASAVQLGNYDTTFNPSQGFNMFQIALDQYPVDLAADSAGNSYIAMVMETTDGTTGFRPAVLKVKADGTRDYSFGTNGLFTVPVDLPAAQEGSYVDVALASDGDIYLSFPGQGGTPSSWNFFLARIKADGSGLDTSFGLLGLTGAAFDMVGGDDPGDDTPYDMVVQSDGSIVLVGEIERGTHGGTDHDFGIARFTSSGGNDSTFNTDGKQLAYFDLGGGDSDTAFGVSLTSSGEIIVVGQAQTASGFDLAVAVLDSTGNFENTFNTDGKATYEYYDAANNLYAVDNRGYTVTTALNLIKGQRGAISDIIYIGGQSYEPAVLGGNKDMAILCLTGSGDTCTGFGNLGWTLIDLSDTGLFGIGDTDDWVNSIFLDNYGWTLTVVGGAEQTSGDGHTYPATAQISTVDGSVHTAFGADGRRYYPETHAYGLFVNGAQDGAGRTLMTLQHYTAANSTDNPWIGRIESRIEIFYENFESGGLSNWDNVVGGP